MLFPTEALLQRRAEIFRRRQTGEISDVEAAEQALEADPECPAGYSLLAKCCATEGDIAGAQSYGWEALQRMPCDPQGYLSLASFCREEEHASLSRALMALGLWKVSFLAEVPDEVAELFRANQKGGFDASDPYLYGELAAALDQNSAGQQAPDDRLAAYELLNQIEIRADGGVEPELLHRILDQSPALVPLWRAALRRWADEGETPEADALCMMIALLGETAGPEVLSDLMALVASIDPEIFLHANWAVWRLGQRFPRETLAVLAAATGVSQRCAAAEHILLLPETPGRESATFGLLEGFEEFAKEDDASVLLAAVMGTLEQLGRPTDAERAFRHYQKLLRKDDRQWLRDKLESGNDGRLEEADIEDLTIEEICSDRILMDEEDEEDDEDYDFDEEEGEDEFDDVIEPVIVPAKPGRNDPCWCGSGKKYKKCHLTADEETERSGGEAAERVHERVYEQLMEDLYKWTTRSDFEESTRLYFGARPTAIDPEDDRMSSFFEWCLHDFRPPSTGRTLVEECLRRRSGSLRAAERKLLEEWREARFGIWEVQNVKEGEGVELKDWFEGDRFFVNDVSSSRSMLQWDCVFGRIYPSGGRWHFAGNSSGIPRNVMHGLAEQIERESHESGQSAGAFVRTNSHRWHRTVNGLCRAQLDDLRVVNAEGDDFELSSAEYRVEDEDAVADALKRAKPFEAMEDADGVRRFGWLEQTKGPRRSYGSIEIRDGKLRLECNSRKRLAIGRQLVEKHAGNWLQHEGDSSEPLSELKRKAFEHASKGAESPDVRPELSLKLKAEHYERWIDEPIPALDGRTPREATRSETGRKAVEDLLRMMENAEAHGKNRGEAAFDFSTIRKKLGM